VTSALAYFLWVFALSRLTPTQVAVYANMNPMAATLLAALFLSEQLTLHFAAALATVVAGVLLVNWRRGWKRPAGAEEAERPAARA
jgi:drug/metabolite transporter (DMT)-like permease